MDWTSTTESWDTCSVWSTGFCPKKCAQITVEGELETGSADRKVAMTTVVDDGVLVVGGAGGGVLEITGADSDCCSSDQWDHLDADDFLLRVHNFDYTQESDRCAKDDDFVECDLCPAGKYSDTYNSLVCHDCAADEVAVGTGGGMDGGIYEDGAT